MFPFPFLGDCESKSRVVRVWVLTDELPLERAKGAKVRSAGPVAELTWAKAPEDLAEALAALHAQTPLLLAVRPEPTKALTAWHAASVGDERVLPALERLARSSSEYAGAKLPLRGSRDVSVQLFKAFEGRAPRAEAFAATLKALLDASPGKARAPLRARLEDWLPRCAGFDFAVDVVIQNVLAKVRRCPANKVPMSEPYQRELQRQMKAVLDETSWDAATLDWARRDDVLAALAAGRWKELASSLREGDEAHVATVLSLEPDTLRALSTHGFNQATRLANIATMLMPLVGTQASAPAGGLYALPEQRWEQVLRLFDAAIEGELMSMAAANPLFAVQDDFHHQGVDAVRARRYLERCLPHGEKNAAVFLNAAGVYMELAEPARALECLVAAKKGGFNVRAHRNEKLFAPLQHDARFQAVMARGS